MATTITGGPNGTLVQYKLAGKFYNTANAEAGGSADPFEEKRLAAGDTLTLEDGDTLIAQRELGGINPQGGTPDSGIDESAETPTPTGTAIPGGQYGTPDENR